jgi:hypothetical protein
MKESRITTYLRLTQKQSNIFLIRKERNIFSEFLDIFDVFINVYKQIKENEVKKKQNG